ncbi:MAG: RHS repeat-associated core domain-containing protein, partial [Sphingobacteriia bacterium]
VVQAQDYTAFGAAMEGPSFSISADRFGFSGKENDTDRGPQLIQDYGFRLYNPALGRFLTVDPLMREYPWYTPYQFAGNKPINSIDRDGLEEFEVTQDPTTGDVGGVSQRTDVDWNYGDLHRNHAAAPGPVARTLQL